MELTTMYESLGVSRAVYEYGEKILAELKPRFEALDQTAEYNQTKVLAAMQKNKLSAGCFAATTGYGYDDMGREVLEKVYADCFGADHLRHARAGRRAGRESAAGRRAAEPERRAV